MLDTTCSLDISLLEARAEFVRKYALFFLNWPLSLACSAHLLEYLATQYLSAQAPALPAIGKFS